MAHSFAAMVDPLGVVQRGLGADLDDPRFVRVRDGYLEVFADLGPRDELADTLEHACRVAKIARVLTWERAFRAARELDEKIEENFMHASLETLESLLDPSWLGGSR